MNKFTLKKIMENSFNKYADLPAVSWVDGEPITYSEMEEKITHLSSCLHKKGIGFGDRVAILSENMPNWSIAYFSIINLGAIAVPILPDFHINEVEHIIMKTNAKAIFVSKKLFGKIEALETDFSLSRILMDDFSIIPDDIESSLVKKLLKSGSKELQKVANVALKITKFIPPEVREDDVASIIFTSGTTGHSKGVVLTHKNIVKDAIGGYNIQNLDSNDRMLSILPLSHTYEFTIGLVLPLMCGASVYYLDKIPAPRILLKAMQKIRPTLVLTVPLIMEKIYKNKILPGFQKNVVLKTLYKIPFTRKILNKIAGKQVMKSFGGKIKFFGIGGALLSYDVEQFLFEAKFPYAIGYGLTETSPLIAGFCPKEAVFRSTGKAITGLKIRIKNKNEHTQEGEIWVKGDTVMKEYYNEPEKTKEVLVDGWFNTGDLGIYKNGILYIKGRSKNVIVGPSGENIYPEEIEARINRCLLVDESLVYEQNGKIVARVHLKYEEIDKLYPKMNEEKVHKKVMIILNEIKTNVNRDLSKYSNIHKIIEQTEEFVKTPTNKIKRYLYN